MPIVTADIGWLLSGGTANADPNAALGGDSSSTALADAVDNNLFDDVPYAEALAGDIEYRGIYVRNNHATLTLTDARVYISAPTPAALTELDIAVADEAVNVSMETIANENTAPVGPVFSRPVDYATGLPLNGATGLAPGAFKGIWVRRTITAGAGVSADTATIKVEGTTLP